MAPRGPALRPPGSAARQPRGTRGSAPPAQTFRRAGQRRPTPSRWSWEGAGPAPSPAGPALPWPGAPPPSLRPSVPALAPRSAPAAARGGEPRPAPGSHGGAAGGRPAGLVAARSPPQPCRARSAARRPQPVRPRRPGTAPPRAPPLSHGGRAPPSPGAAGQDGRSLPRSLPPPRRGCGSGAGRDSVPAGGRQSSGPARPCRRGECAGRGKPAPAAGLRSGHGEQLSGGTAGRGGRLGGRPRTPAAETFVGVGGVGSGGELCAAAGMDALPAGPGPGPGGHRRAHLRTRPGSGQGRRSSVQSGRAGCARLCLCPAVPARAAASRSTLLACSSSELVHGLLVKILTYAFCTAVGQF